jgi:4-amino-4-deoxy-L-arabinose transferase-like glycosyltransferase
MTKTAARQVVPFLGAFGLLTLLVSRNPFFWDTVQLASKQAHWFHDHGFGSLILPNEIDSGHPPAFGLYIALVWKVLGRTLPASHFAMLPFLFGIVLAARCLVSRFFPAERVPWAMLFLLAEPTLLAQSVLVSPDIVLLFFYLACVNAILSGRRGRLALCLCGLGLISLRGMISMVAVFLSDVVLAPGRSGDRPAARIVRLGAAYLPVLALIAAWLAAHRAATGWIGYHPASPWAQSFRFVPIPTLLVNVGILGWRLADFGRVFLWIAAAALLADRARRGARLEEAPRAALALFLPALFVMAATMVPRQDLMGHRYLLPAYVFFGLFVYGLLERVASARRRGALYAALVAGLLTGHLWQYPERVATGWDATLGHVPYYGLRAKMIRYIQEQGIAPESVGSDFPNLGSPRITDLGDEEWHFHAKDLRTDEYVFYAFVFNGFTGAELEELRSRWTVEREYRCLSRRVTLYRRPEPGS